MVKVKYSALYTDNLGCEQAQVYFLKDGLELKVRNCIFKNDDLNFDFYSNNSEKIKNIFYLKNNELVEYYIDIKIPLILTYNGIECVKEFLLRIERNKNHYNNSLSFSIKGKLYMVDGYDLKELLEKMKNKLSKEYCIEDGFSTVFGAYYLGTEKNKNLHCLKNHDEKLNNVSNEDPYSYLFNIKPKKNFERLQKTPGTYIFSESCSS